jgi:hypothetical protein
MIAMIKKLLLSIAPVLVLASFAVMPAMASANTREYGTCETGTHTAGCPTGEKNFKAFTAKTKVRDKKVVGSANFILENTVSHAKIECKKVFSAGIDENVGTPPNAVGHSTDTLIFEECSTKVGTATCKVSTGGSSVIAGTVSDEVLAGGLGVSITVTSGFEINFQGNEPECPPEETEVGTVTGTTSGTQAVETNILKFAAATGLKLNGVASTITGSTETVTQGTNKAVVIN